MRDFMASARRGAGRGGRAAREGSQGGNGSGAGGKGRLKPVRMRLSDTLQAMVFKEDNLPYPEQNYKQFEVRITAALQREMTQWDPLRRKPKPLVSVSRLRKTYSNGQCSVM